MSKTIEERADDYADKKEFAIWATPYNLSKMGYIKGATDQQALMQEEITQLKSDKVTLQKTTEVIRQKLALYGGLTPEQVNQALELLTDSIQWDTDHLENIEKIRALLATIKN